MGVSRHFMKIIAFLLFSILLINCSLSKITYIGNQKDNDLIIEEIISFNNFQAEKNDPTKNRIASSIMKIGKDFKKSTIKSFEDYFLPIGPDGKPDYNSEKYILKSDYKYFIYQNQESRITEIGESIKNKFINASIADINDDRRNGNSYAYLEFSDIYFSQDRKTAYIEVNHHHSGIYGEGTAYILKKFDGNWKIVRTLNLWIA